MPTYSYSNGEAFFAAAVSLTRPPNPCAQNSVQNIIGSSPVSLTPSSPNRIRFPRTASITNFRTGGMDSDFIYDLPEETSSYVTFTGGNRSSSLQMEINPVTNKRSPNPDDGGNLNDQIIGNGTVSSLVKKRKLDTSSPSITAPTKNPTQTCAHNSEGDKPQLKYDIERGQQSSLIKTLQDSRPGPKNRMRSLGLKDESIQMELFRSPSITKPSSLRAKSLAQKPRLQSRRHHLDWTTTEDALKLGSHTLARTTLEKLCAFRYSVPGTRCQSEESTTLAVDEVESISDRLQEGPVQAELAPLPDFGVLRSGASVVDRSLSNPQTKPQLEIGIAGGIRSAIDSIAVSTSFASGSVEELDVLLGSKKLAVTYGAVEIAIQKSYAGAQSELSGPEVCDSAHYETFKNGYTSDEFDEGIDSNVFLAVVSNNILPINLSPNLDGSKMQRSNTERSSLKEVPPHDTAASLKVQTNLTSAGSPTKLPQPGTVLPSLPRHTSDIDDEYPMDSADEDELVQLPELEICVKENFTPPASLEYPFEDSSFTREVYDRSLKFSPVEARNLGEIQCKIGRCDATDSYSAQRSPKAFSYLESAYMGDEEDWTFIQSSDHQKDREMDLSRETILEKQLLLAAAEPEQGPKFTSTPSLPLLLDDTHEYRPLAPFARPDFPLAIRDHSPVVGFSAQTTLRTCFRIGEMFKAGTRSNALGLDTVIELFARVTFSSREAGTTRQHFQFADLWHDRPPFPNGLLANYKVTSRAETESKVFVGAEEGMMGRCLGRLRRDTKNTGWLLQISHIRATDWEEIRWTKRIVAGDVVQSGACVGVEKL